VAAEIVHDHDITWLEAGEEVLLDIAQEAFAIDLKSSRRTVNRLNSGPGSTHDGL
jgi:hypothetical protein